MVCGMNQGESGNVIYVIGGEMEKVILKPKRRINI